MALVLFFSSLQKGNYTYFTTIRNIGCHWQKKRQSFLKIILDWDLFSVRAKHQMCGCLETEQRIHLPNLQILSNMRIFANMPITQPICQVGVKTLTLPIQHSSS